ncbi:MAG: hypothetical protein JSW60_09285 [Thermoplasmatales archaeon]|nr:MAG: hypothetical protein JSW60_09285 [Thermoplasmatales archaeon]
MKFGVVICPHCKKVKGVDLFRKTTKCPRCGKVLRLENLKIFYKTDSRGKLQQAIGLVNAELDGKLKEFKEILQNRRQ